MSRVGNRALQVSKNKKKSADRLHPGARVYMGAFCSFTFFSFTHDFLTLTLSLSGTLYTTTTIIIFSFVVVVVVVFIIKLTPISSDTTPFIYLFICSHTYVFLPFPLPLPTPTPHPPDIYYPNTITALHHVHIIQLFLPPLFFIFFYLLSTAAGACPTAWTPVSHPASECTKGDFCGAPSRPVWTHESYRDSVPPAGSAVR